MVNWGRITRIVGVEQGLSGWYAVLYDNEGVIQTGLGRYQTRDQAVAEALDWADAEGHRLEAGLITDRAGDPHVD